MLLPDERFDTVNERIRLIQKKNGLTFGTDAFLLSAFVSPMKNTTAVDLGSGTGIIPLLLLAKEKVKKVYAVEIQHSFADVIRRNADLNGMSERLFPIEKDLRALTARDVGCEVQLVCANPPYLPIGSGRHSDFPEKEIARHECNGNVADFCLCASKLLQTKGKFVCVWRPERLPELFSAMREVRIEPKRTVSVFPDCRSAPCLVLVEGVKDASPGMKVFPPLFLYRVAKKGESVRTMTKVAKSVYDTCSFSALERR